jgi:hypothetical protein
MKIVIGETGLLRLERAGEMKNQGCPFIEAQCGDWCPHFEEPGEANAKGILMLTCGHGACLVGDIEDRRRREAT